MRVNVNRRRFSLQSLSGLFVASCSANRSLSVMRKGWVKEASLPIPLQEIYPAAFDGHIYVAGGFTPSDHPIFAKYGVAARTFIFSARDKAWREGPNLPEPCHHLGMAANNDYLYGVGGFHGVRGNVWNITSSVFKLDHMSAVWEVGPSLPSPQAESVYATLNENIHIVGGKRRDKKSGAIADSNRHFVLMDNAHWEEAAPSLRSRTSAAGAVINQRLYVVGGRRSGGYDQNLHHAEVYDSSRDVWETISPLPAALAGHCAVAHEGKLYVFGGEIFGAQGDWRTGKAFNSTWVYDPKRDAWALLEVMPRPRHGLGAVGLSGRIYIIGGAHESGPRSVTNSMLSLAPGNDYK